MKYTGIRTEQISNLMKYNWISILKKQKFWRIISPFLFRFRQRKINYSHAEEEFQHYYLHYQKIESARNIILFHDLAPNQEHLNSFFKMRCFDPKFNLLWKRLQSAYYILQSLTSKYTSQR